MDTHQTAQVLAIAATEGAEYAASGLDCPDDHVIQARTLAIAHRQELFANGDPAASGFDDDNLPDSFLSAITKVWQISFAAAAQSTQLAQTQLSSDLDVFDLIVAGDELASTFQRFTSRSGAATPTDVRDAITALLEYARSEFGGACGSAFAVESNDTDLDKLGPVFAIPLLAYGESTTRNLASSS